MSTTDSAIPIRVEYYQFTTGNSPTQHSDVYNMWITLTGLGLQNSGSHNNLETQIFYSTLSIAGRRQNFQITPHGSITMSKWLNPLT